MDINTKLELIDSLRSDIQGHEQILKEINHFKLDIPGYEKAKKDGNDLFHFLHRHSLISKIFGLIGFKGHNDPEAGGSHLTTYANFNYDIELLEALEQFFELRLASKKTKLNDYLSNVKEIPA